MNETIQIFLAILKAAMLGEKPDIPAHISMEQWHTIFRLAGIHNVLPLIWEAVYDHPSLAGQPLLSTLRQQVRSL